MDTICEKVKKLAIFDSVDLKLSVTIVDGCRQRCRISSETFDRLGLARGDVVLVSSGSERYVCVAASARFASPDVVRASRPPNETANGASVVRLCGAAEVGVAAEATAVVRRKGPGPPVDRDALARFALAGTVLSGVGVATVADGIAVEIRALPSGRPVRIGPTTALRVREEEAARETRAAGPLFGLEAPLARLAAVLRDDGPDGVLRPTKQVLLVGPPGTGKTSLVRLAAENADLPLLSPEGPDPDETGAAVERAFARAFERSRRKERAIVFLDGLDDLCPDERAETAGARRTVARLTRLLDRAQSAPGVIVVATSDAAERINSSMRRQGRLETEIHIGPPSEEQRRQILHNSVENLNLGLSASDLRTLVETVAGITPGHVGADLKSICQRISWKISSENMKNPDIHHWTSEFRHIVSKTGSLSLRESSAENLESRFCFDDLCGADEIKRGLTSSLIWPLMYPEAFARMGIARPRGVLLYGPPGCGKTLMVKALAAKGTFAFLSVSAADLYSPYVGDAEKYVTELFRRARRNSPCLIFVDEIDALVGARGDRGDGGCDVAGRILAALLTEMDGVGGGPADDGIAVVAATNRPEAIDPALLRPGRFDRHVYAPPPDFGSRLGILGRLLNGVPVSSDVDLSELAALAENCSGADLKGLVAEAALAALAERGLDARSIEREHFVDAIARIKRVS